MGIVIKIAIDKMYQVLSSLIESPQSVNSWQIHYLRLNSGNKFKIKLENVFNYTFPI